MDQNAPGIDDMLAIAQEVVAAFPAPFRNGARDVLVRVVDFPIEDMLPEQADPFSLTGLYDGTPLTEKSVMDQPQGPDTVWLFRRPILDEWAERGNITLRELIAHVTVHEFAHHFGWSDADIAAIDRWWD